MNSTPLTGNWERIKTQVKEQWHELTDDEISQVDGRRDQLVDTLQKRYGLDHKEADRQVSRFEASRDF